MCLLNEKTEKSARKYLQNTSKNLKRIRKLVKDRSQLYVYDDAVYILFMISMVNGFVPMLSLWLIPLTMLAILNQQDILTHLESAKHLTKIC